jgi:hypothetical protein
VFLRAVLVNDRNERGADLDTPDTAQEMGNAAAGPAGLLRSTALFPTRWKWLGDGSVEAGDGHMSTRTGLERRLRKLESAAGVETEKEMDWRIAFLHSLPEDEAELELDWVVPSLLRTLIGVNAGGYTVPPLSPLSPFAADPRFGELWGRWGGRYHYLLHEWSMGRLTQAQGPRDAFDFWTRRADSEQELLRRELVQRMKAVLQATDNPLHLALSGWQPSSADACTTWPSQVYCRWSDSRNGA